MGTPEPGSWSGTGELPPLKVDANRSGVLGALHSFFGKISGFRDPRRTAFRASLSEHGYACSCSPLASCVAFCAAYLVFGAVLRDPYDSDNFTYQ